MSYGGQQVHQSRQRAVQSQADMVRQSEAQRAAEMMLSSSLASSVESSLTSQTPSLPSYSTYMQSRLLQPPPEQGGSGYSSYSYNTEAGAQVRLVMTDDLVSGTSTHGSLSPVRRFFVLLCTFDVLFICLLWIIAILVTGRDLVKELHQQVLEYTIHSSMFDCVVTAVFRFVICLSFYALLSVSHWGPIATTTATTIAFLVAKVFQYQWQPGQPITYDVMLILLSFILAWAEVWFFDFRLIPLERKAREMWSSRAGQETERTPLLAPSQTLLPRFLQGSTLYEGSVGNFYSPLQSPHDSGDEEEEEELVVAGLRVPGKFRRRAEKPLTGQEREFIKTGEEVLATALRIINSTDWRLERQTDNGDTVQVKFVNGKKVFKLTGYLHTAPAALMEELYYRLEDLPSWNPTVEEVRLVQVVDHRTDVTHQVCAEAGGGLVSVRDFVNLRHWEQRSDGSYVSAVVSVVHPSMPPQQGRVRGENRPGCFLISPVPGDRQAAVFQWLLDTDLKGWIPQSIIDKALSGVQLDYIQRLRSRAASLG